jgi:ferredoxin
MAKEGFFRSLFKSSNSEKESQENLAQLGRVVPDANRCVQCGVCGYNCPIGIQVRDYAHRGLPVDDPRCITCGNCINVCPRGTLRWETQAHSLILDRFLLTVDSNV